MRHQWSRLAIALGMLGAVVLGGLVVNQTAQLVALAAAIHPTAGTVTLVGLLLLYGIGLLVPIILIARLPRPLQPPPTDHGPAFERHLQAVGRRLARNLRAGPGPFRTRAEIEVGLAHLGAQADEIARTAAAETFITTAVSQHGSLDAVVMIGVQTRLVWRIAHLYHQRPGIRELGRLYLNVAATAFIAGEIEDLDVSDQLQPIVSGVLGSMAGSVPGLHTASTVLATSILSGATNAFLTLRVALIAKQYCAALTARPRRRLRRTALIDAGAMLGGIVTDGVRRISQALLTASGRTVTGTARHLSRRVRAASQALADRLGASSES